MIDSWIKLHDSFNSNVQEWISSIAIHRESTYLSCWSRADSMSLAMWNLYRGGSESIAIRTTTLKLKRILDQSEASLRAQGYGGEIIDVHYADGLKEPDESLREVLLERLSLGENVRVGEFSIKPSIYEYEREVGAILYPKRGIREPEIDPNPELKGISLPIGSSQNEDSESLIEFIDSVYLHPTLGPTAMMVRVVNSLHASFGLQRIPIVADKMEAIGSEISLRPMGQIIS